MSSTSSPLLLHVEGARVGLREVDIAAVAPGGRNPSAHVLRLNRVPLRVRGVNRHEHSDGTRGKVVDAWGMVRDAALIKRANMNAVRCSHYPNASFWYCVCDEIGLCE
jgi:beta-galactosidase